MSNYNSQSINSTKPFSRQLSNVAIHPRKVSRFDHLLLSTGEFNENIFTRHTLGGKKLYW